MNGRKGLLIMGHPRVWINYKPRIYTEIFKYIFQSIDLVEIVDFEPSNSGSSGVHDKDIDIVLLSLNGLEQPDIDLPEERKHEAKVIAFSSKGDYGLKRLPGKTNWEEMRPFGLKELIDELSAGRSSGE